jgi:hypothetical protein
VCVTRPLAAERERPRRSEGAARAERGEESSEAQNAGRAKWGAANSESAARWDSPRVACVGWRAVCAVIPRVVRAPPRRRAGGARERRAATDRTREEDKRRRPRQRPCSTAAAKTTRDLRAQRAPRACRSSLCARSSLAPHEEAIEEKTRDKDDDRRRGRGAKDHHGARCPAELRW